MANNVKIPPKHEKNPIELRLNEKFDMLTPSLAQSMKRTTNGAAVRTVNKSDTNRAGRFSG